MKKKFLLNQVHKEPYIDLNIKDLQRWNKLDEITYAQMQRQKYKYEFFQKAFDLIYDNTIVGDYFEFGVHKARTFRFAMSQAKRRNMKKIKFLAFDSFEGLPDVNNNIKQNDKFKKGLLITSENKFKNYIKDFNFYKNNVKIIKGFYEKSLNKKLISALKKQKTKACLINFDCDLTQSVDQALKFSMNFLQEGTIIYFDDYFSSYKGNPNKGIPNIIKKRFKNSKFDIVEYLNIGYAAKSFIIYNK
jgi:O-methyltransferase